MRDERFDAGCPCGAHSGKNAAARRQNIEVFCAFKTHLKLLGAVSTPDDMRMGVNKPRHHHAAISILHRFIGMSSAQFRGLAHFDNFLIADQHCSILDNAKLAQIVAALRPPGDG